MLSILLPAYNSEKYIGECIESILSQTFTDFELIIIDDCSTDGTLNIIKNYASQDKRIKYLKNDTNLGVGVCRKYAFSKSIGEFILNVDSDDYLVGNNLLSSAMNVFSDKDIDIVTFPFRSENKKRRYNNWKYNIITNNKENILKIDSFATIWNKVIKRTLYEHENMFSEQRKEEPTITYFKCVYYANKIACLPNSNDNYYYYRTNENSITKQADEVDFATFYVKTQILLYEFFNENNAPYFKDIFNIKNIKNGIDLFEKVEQQIKEKHESEYQQLKVIIDNYMNI